MSDRIELLESFRRNPRRSSQDLLRLRETAARLRTGQTASQRELSQFIPQAEEDEDEERSRIKPLQFIFNLLQTGGFVTANIANEIRKSWQTGESLSEAAVDAIGAAWEGAKAGLTGGREGTPMSFEEVFFSHIPKEERNFGQKLVGFAADVLLDPTTYISFGASTAARAAAGKFALDATKVAAKTLGSDVAQRLGGDVLQASGDDLFKGLKKLATDDPLRRELSREYNRAYREALNVPRGVPADEFAGKLQQQLKDQVRPLAASSTTRIGRRGMQITTETAGVPGGANQAGIRDLMASISEGYGGAGERTARLFKLEFHKGVRPPNVAAQAWNTFRASFEKTAIGNRFGDAWWAVMNGGPVDGIRVAMGQPAKGIGLVGTMRKAFGFLDEPLQKALRLQRREWEEGYHAAATNEVGKITQITSRLDDQQRAFLVDMRSQAHDEGIPSSDLLVRQGADQRIIEANDDIQKVVDDWAEKEKALAQEGIIVDFNLDLNYLPKMGGQPLSGFSKAKEIGSANPRFAQTSTASFSQHRDRNKRRLRAVLGKSLYTAAEQGGRTTDEILDDLIQNKGMADIEVGLEEMFAIRALLHARVMNRAKMIRSFREFGIPINQLPQPMQETLNVAGKVDELGLHAVADPSLKGFAFDSDVAGIINRTYDATSTDAGVNAIKKGFAWYTRLWKGFATATPRFHIRNFISNNTTGFLKHGVRWFHGPTHLDALAASYYALHRNNMVDLIADQLNIPHKAAERLVTARLSNRVGNKTVKEWADEALERGVISKRTFFSEDRIAESVEQFTGKTKENVLFRSSRAVGDVIENQARMQSFLLDIQQAGGARGASDYAANEAKKWFLDYGDLTSFEQGFMKKIFPFYTWMRKNLANQISGLVLHGDLYSIIPKGQAFAQRALGVNDEDFDYELLKDWQQNLGLFPIWHDAASKKAVLFDPFFAYQDLNNLPFYFEEGKILPTTAIVEGASEIGSAAHPIIKTIAELISGKNLFKKEDIRDMEFAPGVLREFNRAPGLLEFLDGALRKVGIRGGLPMEIRDDKVYMDGKLERFLDNNLPLLRTVGSVIEGVEGVAAIGSEDLESILQQAQEEPDYESALSVILRGFGFLAGAKFRQFDVEEQERLRAEEVRERAEIERREVRRTLPGFEQRSADASRRRLQELQKLRLL